MAKGKLTTRQIKYCRLRAAGKDRQDAYRAAGYSDKGTAKTLRDNAYNMETKNTAILQRIKELQERADAGGIMDRKARMQLLNEIALNETVKETDRLRAIDQLNRMNSDYNDTLKIDAAAGIQLSYAERLDAIKQSLENV